MTFSRLHLRSVCGHLLNNYNIEVMFRFLNLRLVVIWIRYVGPTSLLYVKSI